MARSADNTTFYENIQLKEQVRILRACLEAAGVPAKTVDAILRGETAPGDPRQLKMFDKE